MTSRRLRSSWVVAASVMILAVAACGGDKVEAPDPIALNDSDVAVIGDSYSAGEGLAPYDADTDDIALGGNRCHRSPLAYARVIETAPRIRLVFRACSGARLRHVIDEVQEHGGRRVDTTPQGDLLDAGLDLLVLTISGNDAEFSDVVKHCALNFGCMDDADWEHGSSSAPTLRAWAEQMLARIQSGLAPLFTELRTRAPRARILVVGYPRLFSDKWDVGGQPECTGYLVFSKAERRDVRALADRLNASIAAAAIGAGLEYVDAADAFEGHESCGHLGQWLHFSKLERNDDGRFHPTAVGQRALARIVSCYLAVNASNPYPQDPDLPALRTKPIAVAGGVAAGFTGDEVHRCARGESP